MQKKYKRKYKENTNGIQRNTKNIRKKHKEIQKNIQKVQRIYKRKYKGIQKKHKRKSTKEIQKGGFTKDGPVRILGFLPVQ